MTSLSLRPGVKPFQLELEVEVPDQGRGGGVIARPVSPMFHAATPLQALMLGFSGYEPGALRWSAKVA